MPLSFFPVTRHYQPVIKSCSFLVPKVPHNPRVSEFVNPVMNAYEAGRNRTLRYAVYGAIMMWEGPEIGYFDGFHVTISPPDGMIRHPIKFKSKF